MQLVHTWWYLDSCWHLRTVSAWLILGTIPLTLIICFTMSHTTGAYMGGIPFGYISDVGRDDPVYFVMSFFVSLSAVCMCVLMLVQYQYVDRWLNLKALATTHYSKLNLCATLLGISVAFVLSLFVTYDATRFFTTHESIRIALSVFVFLYISAETLLFYFLQCFHVSFLWSFRCKLLLLVSSLPIMILYLPVGFTFVCDPSYLSMVDCIQREGLETSYCFGWELFGSLGNTTMLLSYEECPKVNLMRSVTEFLQLIVVVLYIGTFLLDPPSPPSLEDHSTANHETEC